MATGFYRTVQSMSQKKRIDSIRKLKLRVRIISIKVHKEANKLEDEDCQYKAIHVDNSKQSVIIKLQFVLFEKEEEGGELQ